MTCVRGTSSEAWNAPAIQSLFFCESMPLCSWNFLANLHAPSDMYDILFGDVLGTGVTNTSPEGQSAERGWFDQDQGALKGTELR